MGVHILHSLSNFNELLVWNNLNISVVNVDRDREQ